MKDKFLITAALPYSNGYLHIGHIMEFIQADIFARYSKLINNNCVFISGDDCHGTPIMIKSIENKCTPNFLFNFYHIFHKRDLFNNNIDLTHFYLTHSYENEFFSRRFFILLKSNKFLFKKFMFQLYDEKKQMFLPDRYVKGTCPKCKSQDQSGDVCEVCSFNYDAIELLDPISSVSGTIPIKLSSNHYFFDLAIFENFLKSWVNKLSQEFVFNKLNEWFLCGLKSWNISRDLPYFGFKIPGECFKFFYVWLDAPIGYLSSFYNYCIINNFDFTYLLSNKSNFKLYHFIGKDIIYFHFLFWPAILKACGFKLPEDIFVHGFLNINNKKMSKSKGTLLNIENFLSKYESDYIRYYFASKLTENIFDIDFKIEEFIDKINSDLISKFVNIGSRCINIINNNFNSCLSNNIFCKDLILEFLNFWPNIKNFYFSRSYSKLIVSIMKFVDVINIYIDREKPWLLLKDKNTFYRANDVCTLALNLFIIILFYIKPILPSLVYKFEYLLNIDELTYDSLKNNFFNINIKKYIHVCKKINV